MIYLTILMLWRIIMYIECRQCLLDLRVAVSTAAWHYACLYTFVCNCFCNWTLLFIKINLEVVALRYPLDMRHCFYLMTLSNKLFWMSIYYIPLVRYLELCLLLLCNFYMKNIVFCDYCSCLTSTVQFLVKN